MLEIEGHHVASAANGREALDRLEAEPFDVVLLDLVMPEQEGLETIQRLRRKDNRPFIIAMSGAFGGEYLRIARSLGADQMLQKPISRADLARVINEHLAGGSTR